MMILAAQNGSADFRFVLFTACIFAAIAGGYVLRRLGVVKPEWAGRALPGNVPELRLMTYPSRPRRPHTRHFSYRLVAPAPVK